MTASLIAPVIPSATRAAGRRPGRGRGCAALPLAAAALPGAAGRVVYGFGRIDRFRAGRDRVVTGGAGLA